MVFNEILQYNKWCADKLNLEDNVESKMYEIDSRWIYLQLQLHDLTDYWYFKVFVLFFVLTKIKP